jgi:hypothetical protein
MSKRPEFAGMGAMAWFVAHPLKIRPAQARLTMQMIELYFFMLWAPFA